MIFEYAKFFVNGGILGILAWGLQMLIFQAFGSNTAYFYVLASSLTYVFLVPINFMIQRVWIFKQDGLFFRFLMANLLMMLLVSTLSSVCRYILDLIIGNQWGNRGGFIVAALLGSVPSFLIQKFWVFKPVPDNNHI